MIAEWIYLEVMQIILPMPYVIGNRSLMDKPSNMSSKDIWGYIMGYNIPPGSFSINELRMLESIQKENLNRRMELIGEHVGIFVVLAIYAGLFCLISHLFTPLKYIQCLGISIGIFLASKIFTIPIIRFINKSTKEAMHG